MNRIRKHLRNTKLFFLFLGILLILAAAGGICCGPAGLPESISLSDPLFRLRLTRVCAAFVIGGSLSLAGAVYQAVLRNVLAEPFILGVSSGAGVGAALAFAFGLHQMSLNMVPFAAFTGAAAALILVMVIAYGKGAETLILGGVIAGTIASSILSVIVTTAGVDELCSLTWWLMGDLQSVDPRLLTWVSLADCAAVLVVFLYATDANLLSLGEDYAWNAGIRTARSSAVLLTAASLMAAQTVALAGIISFVGLIVPHIIRRIYRADNRYLFPASLIGGGIFLIFCDILSRILLPHRELPVGLISALIGGGLFLYIISKRREVFYDDSAS